MPLATNPYEPKESPTRDSSAPATTGAKQSHRPLRADAERNRRRILTAARQLFAHHGLEVTLDDVARQAGVGVGTVYRRFPNKDELIEGVFEDTLTELAHKCDEASHEPSSWDALADIMEILCSTIAHNRGLAEVFTSIEAQSNSLTIKSQISQSVRKMIIRCKQDGVVRNDAEEADFHAVIWMVSTVADMTEDVVPGAWRRYLHILLTGLRTDGSTNALVGPTLTDEHIATIRQKAHNYRTRNVTPSRPDRRC